MGALAGLEEAARTAGYPTLRLSTGELQPEAIALYESSGYALTTPWGKYVDQAGTRCYAKGIRVEFSGDRTSHFHG
jgi:hypothetical protein